MEGAVRALREGSTAKEITDVLIADVNSFKGSAKQYDDMTIVVARVL